MLRLLASRHVLGATVFAAGTAGFALGPPDCKSLTLELERGAASALRASLDAALAKPAVVAQNIERDGEHAWLEEVLGERALAWVRAGNEEALGRLGGDPTGSTLYNRLYSILTSKDKIPHLSKVGGAYYNFWTDDENPRGVLRRTTLESYRTGKPEWEVVLSIDALNKEEGQSWVYKGHDAYRPTDGSPPTRTLMHLSRGGADATVVREFDLRAKAFVAAEAGGFVVPEAKTRVSWQSADALLIGTDFGDGRSLTDSGYPRTIREWRRGTPLAASVEVYAGERADVSVTGYVSRHRAALWFDPATCALDRPLPPATPACWPCLPLTQRPHDRAATPQGTLSTRCTTAPTPSTTARSGCASATLMAPSARGAGWQCRTTARRRNSAASSSSSCGRAGAPTCLGRCSRLRRHCSWRTRTHRRPAVHRPRE